MRREAIVIRRADILLDYKIKKLQKMKKERLILGIVLFTLGFIGVLSILTMNIPLSDEASKLLLEQFTPKQIKFLTLKKTNEKTISYT